MVNTAESILKNKIIKKISRKSKYLILHLGNICCLIHLGMSGTIHIVDRFKISKFTNTSFYHSPTLPKKHNHVVFEFDNFKVIYNDPRRFGFFQLIKNENALKERFKHLGPEPFDKKFNLNYVMSFFKDKNKEIKSFLLDQRFVSGIGNIYASEILFLSKIDPFKQAKLLNKNECKIYGRGIDGYTYKADSGDLLVPTGGTNGPKPSTLITVDTFGNRSPLWQAPRAVVPGSTMLMEAGGVLYPIVNATPKSSTDKTEFVIEVYSPLNAFDKSNRGFVEDVPDGDTIKFYLQSYISTGGHTMEFVGSGTDYRSHPDYGGVPVVTNQTVELGGTDLTSTAPQLVPYNGGRVWLSSTDQDGNFNVGDTFQVNQKTGQIYIDPSVIVQPPLKIQENLDMGPWSIYTTYGTDTNLNLAPKGDGGLVIGGDVKTDGSAPVGPSTAPIIGPVKERSQNDGKDYDVVTQEDLGYDADEIPVSGLLGKLAFTDTPSVVGVSDSAPLPNELKFSVSGATLTISFQPPGGGAVQTTTLTLS